LPSRFRKGFQRSMHSNTVSVSLRSVKPSRIHDRGDAVRPFFYNALGRAVIFSRSILPARSPGG
jgi:hypothetical protein